jgi:ribonucleotide reductase class II
MHPSSDPFPANAPSANPLFYRSYSRRLEDGSRESWEQVVDRNVSALVKLGRLSPEQEALLRKHQLGLTSLASGRWMWVGGTPWAEDSRNFYGAYNCSSVQVDHLSAFGLLMNLAMQGTGTGAVLSRANVSRLPTIVNRIEVNYRGSLGSSPPDKRSPDTMVTVTNKGHIDIKVGDSRKGWVDSYQKLIDAACDGLLANGELKVTIDLSWVRPPGERLKGFGGVANPTALPETYARVARILNRATGRRLTPLECCLMIDEAARCVVAGNIRRSAGMRQFDEDDAEAAAAKHNLWIQDEEGHWSIDPERDALRMANHTRMFHHKPSHAEVLEAVRSQHACGEGAIQFTPEALARSNADVLTESWLKEGFLDAIEEDGLEGGAKALSIILFGESDIYALSAEEREELDHRMSRFGLNPCLTGDARILTVHQGPKSFQELAEAGKDVLVWCVDLKSNAASVQMMRSPRVTGYDQPVLEIEFDSGLKVRATPEHHFFTLQRNKVQAKDLKPGQSVSAFAIHQHRDGHLRVTRNDRTRDAVRQQFCHRIIAEHYGIAGEVIHHLDHDPTNNHPDNLAGVTSLEHQQEHYPDRVRGGFYHGAPGGRAKEIVANHKVVTVREAGTATVYNGTVDEHHNYVVVDPSAVGKSFASGVLSANCGEILGSDFLCNLAEVHLNRLDPTDTDSVDEAFRAAALTVAVLLHHQFRDERMREARLQDPIVGVSFTGLFDYFVADLGVEWLRWWAEGRPPHTQGLLFSAHEAKTLRRFRAIVEAEVATYCEANNLKVPNRCTTVQPAGCLSLDAVRVTNRGLLLYDEARILSACSDEEDPILIRSTVPMVSTVRNEPAPALRLTLVSGRQITCTPDHRFWVDGTWRRAEALTVGHELEASPGEHSGRPIRTKQLQEPETSPAKTPGSLLPQLAYVAGVALIKDATTVTLPGLRAITDRCLQFSFPLTEEAVCERLSELFSDLFEEPLKRRLSGRTIHLFSRDASLRNWLEQNHLLISDDPETDRLPLALRQSTTAAIRSFFAGLIDATASKTRNQPPTIKIHGEALARHLQEVGEAVGLVFRLQRHQNGKRPYWKLILSRYFSTTPALNYLAIESLHCQGRDMRKTHNCFGYNYWQIASIERTEPIATADICLDADDDDAWYWAGAIRSHNSKSLLTNASAGWHPPKAPYYIRRITFAKDDPIALACLACGYPIVPSQSDKDEAGKLLINPFDERCTEWLVEIPTATPWAEMEGAAEIDTGKFSALAQFDFYMQVQTFYTTHNTSATLELTKPEIEPLATAIHTAIDTSQGYISAALLARFDDKETFPRLPFEPISKERYEELLLEVEGRRTFNGDWSFPEALAHFDLEAATGAPESQGPAGCDGDRCLMPEARPGG